MGNPREVLMDAPADAAPSSYECRACGRCSAAQVNRCPGCRRLGRLQPSTRAPDRRKPNPLGRHTPAYRGFPGLSNVPMGLVSQWMSGSIPVPPGRPAFERPPEDSPHDDFPVGPHLRVSSSLALPPDAATQTFAVLAKRGSGKTYFAAVLVEEFARLRLPVVVLDPVGALWGLGFSADGETLGVSITIVGGDHSDRELDPSSGRLLAAEAVLSDVPYVIDLSHLRRDDQTRFVTEFLVELYHLKAKRRTPMHLVIDEADLYAPQRPEEGQRPMLNAMEDIVRRGRSRGLGVTLVTQRPSVLSKNVLTQTEVLVVLRMTAPQDREAVDEWVKSNGDDVHRKQLLGSLSGLPIGEAWVWSPGWLDVFRRIKVRRRRTFDSSSTPRVLLEAEGESEGVTANETEDTEDGALPVEGRTDSVDMDASSLDPENEM